MLHCYISFSTITRNESEKQLCKFVSDAVVHALMLLDGNLYSGEDSRAMSLMQIVKESRSLSTSQHDFLMTHDLQFVNCLKVH